MSVQEAYKQVHTPIGKCKQRLRQTCREQSLRTAGGGDGWGESACNYMQKKHRPIIYFCHLQQSRSIQLANGLFYRIHTPPCSLLFNLNLLSPLGTSIGERRGGQKKKAAKQDSYQKLRGGKKTPSGVEDSKNSMIRLASYIAAPACQLATDIRRKRRMQDATTTTTRKEGENRGEEEEERRRRRRRRRRMSCTKSNSDTIREDFVLSCCRVSRWI